MNINVLIVSAVMRAGIDIESSPFAFDFLFFAVLFFNVNWFYLGKI